ncbi:MAG: hypothetical protein IT514_04070 [Burkholderiales bacterium]|nr:hypothetical protein [Burkholderiales bacterium]
MTWIERELKKRAARAKPSTADESAVASESARMKELWGKIESANGALPAELRLQTVLVDPGPLPADGPKFFVWLRAANGAALGFSGDAIRYVWPRENPRKSNNFWIRWDLARKRYFLRRRISSTMPAIFVQYAFDERRIRYMIKRLVLGKLLRARSARKKRLWLF